MIPRDEVRRGIRSWTSMSFATLLVLTFGAEAGAVTLATPGLSARGRDGIVCAARNESREVVTAVLSVLNQDGEIVETQELTLAPDALVRHTVTLTPGAEGRRGEGETYTRACKFRADRRDGLRALIELVDPAGATRVALPAQ